MFLNDIAEVLYAPKKAFKRIVANPKYLGIVVILLLFMGLQLGYEYAELSKVHYEHISPMIGATQDFNNATYPITPGSNTPNWQSSSNVALTNNFDDYYNNTVYFAMYNTMYPIFGNFSMQAQANNTNNIMLALSNTSNVDCTANGFQNLSIAIKLVSPASAPSNATLTLYSLGDNNYYTYDLTSMLSNANAVNQWGNLTIPLGPTANGWTESGNPTWQNITSLTMQLTYPSSENITVRIGALLFRGQFTQPLADGANTLNFVYQFVLQFTLQFLATWLILSLMIYVLFRALKAQVLWKPIFVAAGFAIVVMVIRAAVNIAATATLPDLYFPYDAALGVVYDTFGTFYYPSQYVLPVATSAAQMSSITASMATFRTIVTAMFVISYVWLGGLMGIAVKEMKPEYSTIKCFMIAALSVAITILILWLFIGFV